MSLLFSATGAMERTSLPYGSQLIVRRDANVATVAVELWFRAPSIGFADPTPGLSRYAATAVAASKVAGGQSLSEAVKNVGGRLGISAYPDTVSVSASVPSGAESRIIKVMTSAYFTPALSAEGMRSALRDVVVAGTQKRFDVEETLRDGIFGIIFPTGAFHYSTVPPNATALGHVSPDALRAFAARAFRSSNAVLAVAGNTHADIPAAISGGRTDGQAMEAPIDATPIATPASSSAAFAEDAVGLGWVGAPIADAKAATALDFIADYLFRPQSGAVSRPLDISSPETFLSGQFITLHNPGVLLVEIAGKSRDEVRSTVLAAVEKMRTPLGAAEFAAARSAFEYHVLADSQTPLTQADNFGWYSVEGDGLYAPSDESLRYVQTVQSLDPAFVAHVAQQYLGTPSVLELTGPAKSPVKT
ncbi:MAG: insulinase family protein [Candidatus Eremiobacteraeota bacterium]|nr:insulinase family protein [Candidatus Eremiobacteraeota bacterium]